MRFFGHTDAAKRVSDIAVMHWVASGWDSVNKIMVFALADGRSDNVLYPRKLDAVRHQSNEFLYMYVPMHPGGINPCEAEILLKVHRQAYDNGHRWTDPDAKSGGRDLILRQGTREADIQHRFLRTRR